MNRYAVDPYGLPNRFDASPFGVDPGFNPRKWDPIIWCNSQLGIIKDGADLVSNWLDPVTGLSLAQALDAKKPVWTADQLNGKPALVFDGTDDFLRGAFGVTYAQPNTIIIVFKEPVVIGTTEPIFDSFSTRNMFNYYTGTYKLYLGSAYFTSTQVLGTGFKIASVISNGASSIIRFNGVDVSGAGTPGTNSLDGLTLGANVPLTFFSDISVTDILAFNGALTLLQMQQIERYFNLMYNIY